jgi:hypothetical protein
VITIRTRTYTVILFSGMQHGIKPFLEFSPNDRHIFRASAEYLRISFVQNELRLNSGNSIEAGKIHGFTGLTFILPNFVAGKRFSTIFFEIHKFKNFLLKFVGCLVAWPPV